MIAIKEGTEAEAFEAVAKDITVLLGSMKFMDVYEICDETRYGPTTLGKLFAIGSPNRPDNPYKINWTGEPLFRMEKKDGFYEAEYDLTANGKLNNVTLHIIFDEADVNVYKPVLLKIDTPETRK